MAKPIGILGGTFDPVHNGHLRMAIECLERLDLTEVHMIPLYAPPHRPAPHASPEDRLAMLSLAAGKVSGLVVDGSELYRKGVSYTIDTVIAMRERIGNTPVCLLIGTDAFNTLHTWRRWRELLDHVHIVVADRPGAHLITEDKTLNNILDQYLISSAGILHTSPAGKFFHLQIPWLDISATRIRDMIRAGKNPAFLLPGAVIHYIHDHQLYLSNPP
jgi:nicotinate (nicotinamide) nucleotide adenylyltransferase